ncbi:MAG: PAS domain-containing sensor histidine kinase, partial [Desulfobacter sp.]|nr:PAS domain-containing sensor histidine kinase [Desulfobacter sp.]
MTQILQNTRPKRSGRKRECIAILCLLLAVGGLTVLETRVTPFDTGLPLSSTVLMFILININLLLLLTLLLLVFRNLAKLYYERKNNILGSKIKTRLTASFVVLALLPTTVLFFFSIQFISTSIAFWFNAPVEQTLEASLAVGQTLYDYIEEKNAFFAKRGAFQIHSRDLLKPENQEKLTRYTQVIQRAFNRQAVEVYTPDAQRVSISLASELENMYFGLLTTTELLGIRGGSGSHTVYQTMDQGEFLRTVCTIPFDVPPAKAAGFIVINTLTAPDLSENLKAIL